MQVREIMSTDVKVAKPSDPLQEAAKKMAELDAGSLPVCDGERLIGMVTDRDIAIRGVGMGRDPKTAPVTEVMTREVKYCYDDADVEEVSRTMGELQLRRLPIVNRDKKLVGIVSLGDVARATNSRTSGESLRDISKDITSKRR